jgi:hypothetical protein
MRVEMIRTSYAASVFGIAGVSPAFSGAQKVEKLPAKRRHYNTPFRCRMCSNILNFL